MSDEPLDRAHLLSNAQKLFPNAAIEIRYTSDETIHIDVDGHHFTFEIGSDDDEYVFTDGLSTFTVPMMSFDGDF